MKSRNRKARYLLFFLGVLCMACGANNDYDSIVKHELTKGIRQDSIFLGAFFNMPAKEFYDTCWALNKKGLIMEGATNMTVKYNLEGLKFPASLEYYPFFEQGKLKSMTGHIYYNAWAPWNKEMFPALLIEDVKELFQKWYGSYFIEVKSPGWGKAYAQVTANRRVVLYYDRDNRIEMLISDLTNLDEFIKIENKK